MNVKQKVLQLQPLWVCLVKSNFGSHYSKGKWLAQETTVNKRLDTFTLAGALRRLGPFSAAFLQPLYDSAPALLHRRLLLPSLPPSLPDSLFPLTSGISGGQYLLMKCCSIVVEYLCFYRSCLFTSKATVFCSRICSLFFSLVREYNLFHILYSSIVAPLWLHFVFLILSFNSFILTHSKHILAYLSFLVFKWRVKHENYNSSSRSLPFSHGSASSTPPYSHLHGLGGSFHDRRSAHAEPSSSLLQSLLWTYRVAVAEVSLISKAGRMKSRGRVGIFSLL